MQKNQFNRSELEEESSDLLEYFGEENLKFEYFNPDIPNINEQNVEEVMKKMYSQVKLTHLPSGKVVFGTEFETQIENYISAMRHLKRSMS